MDNKTEKNRYLKKLRAGKGLKQEEMATAIGISRSSYLSKENGRVDFSLREIRIIASKFGLGISDINKMFFSELIEKEKLTKVN